jgi:galactarate dehydratase
MSVSTEQTSAATPFYIRMHENDNVAIIANPGGLPKGTEFPCGLTLVGHVPQGHKVALVDLATDDPIVRYGEIIGYALQPLPKGSWISEDLLRMPEAPSLDDVPLATNIPAPLPPLEGYTFEGYRNEDGTVGTKNILGITTTVHCVAGVLDYAVRRIKTELLPRFPNVDDVVAINHPYGCGVAIDAPAAIIPIRTLRNISLNPNLGGAAMVVSLGCEKLAPSRMFPDGTLAEQRNNEPYIVCLQDEVYQGFNDMINAIMEMAKKRLEVLNKRQRETCPASDLIVGMQCGGSDAFSGVTANPAIGFASDLLVRAGATVMFSEVTEVRDAVHMLTARCVNEEVARKMVAEMRWYDDYLEKGEVDRSANTTPGNKKGGLANIVEKALGSTVKSGSAAISGVLSPGEKVNQKGLIFAATPASDFVCGTQQLASGITIQVFSTGRGTPYGLAMAPVIKLGTRTNLVERWHDLIDISAGKIATGEATIEETGWELFRLILDVASDRKQVWSDKWGIHNSITPFNPAPIT